MVKAAEKKASAQARYMKPKKWDEHIQKKRL